MGVGGWIGSKKKWRLTSSSHCIVWSFLLLLPTGFWWCTIKVNIIDTLGPISAQQGLKHIKINNNILFMTCLVLINWNGSLLLRGNNFPNEKDYRHHFLGIAIFLPREFFNHMKENYKVLKMKWRGRDVKMSHGDYLYPPLPDAKILSYPWCQGFFWTHIQHLNRPYKMIMGIFSASWLGIIKTMR